MRTPPDTRHARTGRLRPGERGVTLIELLLSLAILVILTGFLAGGLSIGRRAFDADRVNGIASQTDAAIEVLSGLIGAALPAQGETSDRAASIVFDGRQDIVTFVGLSEGHSLRGGPYKISLQRSGRDVIVNVENLTAARKETDERSLQGIVVLTGVREVSFGYFGRTKASSAPSWRTEWFGAERLPDLVSIRVDFEDERRNQPAVVVALRQG
jgi:general secretion pathway protein J